MKAPSILYSPAGTAVAVQARTADSGGTTGVPEQHGPIKFEIVDDRQIPITTKDYSGRTPYVGYGPDDCEVKRVGAGGESALPQSRKKGQLQWAYLRTHLQTCSDKFDPFAALPIKLNPFQEHLVGFYLYRYPHANYGFNPRLKPHPVGANFSIALDTPACFHISLARSAMYRVSLHTYGSDREMNALEMSVLHHKGEAIRLVHKLSVSFNKSKHCKVKDDLLASIMSLGNLDRRSGSTGTAEMHYAAIRRILKATGGPLAIRSPTLKRSAMFFECIYGTTPNSYIWDNSDVGSLLIELTSFLQVVRKIWLKPPITNDKKVALIATVEDPTCYLDPDSMLCLCLSKGPKEESEISRDGRLELIWQLTCFLTLTTVVVDLHNHVGKLRSYMDSLCALVDGLQTSESETSNNIIWLTQVSDASEEHSKRVLRAAGWAWICKHLNLGMQRNLRDWLQHFLTGQKVEEPFKLDMFHFSYVS